MTARLADLAVLFAVCMFMRPLVIISRAVISRRASRAAQQRRIRIAARRKAGKRPRGYRGLHVPNRFEHSQPCPYLHGRLMCTCD